ncbi:MAG: hypothetical protein ABI883_05995, partial [Chthoniobacterales bacterium]
MASQSRLTSHLSLVVSRWQTRALIIGVIAAIFSLIGLFLNRVQFFHSYLFAWLFWSGLSFGALVVVMMQNLTGGQWGQAVRGLSTAAYRTLPMMALFFIPIVLGIHDIYGWANGRNGEAPGYQHKAQYLNVPFFTARAILYFVVVITITILLARWMGRDGPPGRLIGVTTRDASKPHPRRAQRSRPTARVTALSAGGLIAYVLCMNFAATDWVMSLDPAWYSTVFVEIFAAGHFLSALAVMTALLAVAARNRSLGEAIPTKAFHDLGNMLLAFVIFWTYVSFSQFLIIWSGNLPKEISWYLERSRGGWQWFALGLVLLQFFIPFALLLSRAAKKNRERLGWIAALVALANILAVFWLVAPSFHPEGFYVHWLDFAELIALGGFWC